ncbi:MAG TPA: transposase [Roseiarcus sp.]|nr:transposase [Roseiarcus sp.]
MRVYKHLRRLESVWIEPPLYFLTICVAGRRPILANDQAFDILRGEFGAARERYGWTVGRFVVMPDHLHFFCMSDDLPDSSSLSRFIGGFKQWSAKRIVHAKGVSPPLWQEQFFDRLLRSDESYESKWLYVRDNPVRAGLVDAAEDWPYGGEIATIAR